MVSCAQPIANWAFAAWLMRSFARQGVACECMSVLDWPRLYERRRKGTERNTKVAVVDLVKSDTFSDNEIVKKFQSEHQWELRLGSQLIVNEGQEAVFVKGGVALDVFTPGTHTLVTGNIPFLRKVVNSLFNNKTPFTAEVWFVNRTVKRDLRWGTPKRIPLIDPKFNFPINVGAFGQWGFRVNDSRSFVTQVVGAQLGANSKKIYDYFIGEIIEKFSQVVSQRISAGMSIFQINGNLVEISSAVGAVVKEELEKFGIELINFSISNISIPPEEMAKIQEVMSKRMEMEQLGSVPVGQGYVAARSLDIMQTAAANAGSAGAMMGAATGLGLGFGMGLPVAQQMASTVNAPAAVSPSAPSNNPSNNPMEKLQLLKQMLESGLLTQAEYEAKRAAIIATL